MNRKQKQYIDAVMPKLKEEFGYKNNMEVPKIEKIIINRGVNSEEAKSGNVLDAMIEDIDIITGQKSVTRAAKKSIANFKLRDGVPNGIMTTLRRERMYAFLDKFVSLASPRIRDFRGFVSKGDGNGNFTFGIEDQRIFVEAEDRQKKGFNITIVTSAKSNEEGRALLKEMGVPFRK